MADADVFDILPEVPVSEQWEFVTDVLESYDGSQTRLSVLETPRVSLDVRYQTIDFTARRSLYHTLSKAILTAYAVPFFQYAAPLTADAADSQPRVYFNPALTNIRAGSGAVLYNVLTGSTELFTVDTVETDGATFTTDLANAQTSGLVVCVPAPQCVLPDGQRLASGQNASSASINVQPLESIDLQRPDASVTITTFDSLNVLTQPVLNVTGESWLYRKEIIDGGVGKITVSSRNDYSRVSRTVEFEALRSAGGLDYWREFFATCRGGQVSFLLSTQLPDLSLTTTPSGGATTLAVDEAATYAVYLFPNPSFKRIAIEYSDGTATSYHVVDSVTPTTITLGTAISSTAIGKISFLQRVRASDRVRLDHFQDVTVVKFDVLTVKD